MNRHAQVEAFLVAEPLWRVVEEAPGAPTILAGPAVILGPTDKEYRFDLRLTVPKAFPDEGHPEAGIVAGPFAGLGLDAHVGDSGHLCIQMPYAGEIDYSQVGLLGFFQQVVIHLRRAIIYALTGAYPGPAYSHAEVGKAEFRQELVESFPQPLRKYVQPGLTLPPNIQWCPCGAPLRFKYCHKSSLKKARAKYVAAGGRPRTPSSGPTGR